MNLWYKKKTKQRLFYLGFVLALVLNVDSLQLFRFYTKHPEAQTAVLQYYHNNMVSLSNSASRLDSFYLSDKRAMFIIDTSKKNDTSKPTISIDTLLRMEKNQADSLKKEAQGYIKSIDSLRRDLNLPIGYDYSIFKTFPDTAFDSIFLKLLGLFLSAFAASFGAPFWFDLLRRATTKKTTLS